METKLNLPSILLELDTLQFSCDVNLWVQMITKNFCTLNSPFHPHNPHNPLPHHYAHSQTSTVEFPVARVAGGKRMQLEGSEQGNSQYLEMLAGILNLAIWDVPPHYSNYVLYHH